MAHPKLTTTTCALAHRLTKLNATNQDPMMEDSTRREEVDSQNGEGEEPDPGVGSSGPSLPSNPGGSDEPEEEDGEH